MAKHRSYLIWLGLLLLVALSIFYVDRMTTQLDRALAKPTHAGRVGQGGDSNQYRRIGHGLTQKLSMDYVADQPHRQPLYPAMLAITEYIGGSEVNTLVVANIVIGVITIWALYLGTLWIFGSLVAAFAVVASYLFLN